MSSGAVRPSGLNRRERLMLETRAELVQRSIELFEQRSYGSVTVDDIAAADGVSRATFFRYFEAKSEPLFFDEAESVAALVQLVAHREDRNRTLAALIEPFTTYAGRFEVDAEQAQRRARLIFGSRELQNRAVRSRRKFGRALGNCFAKERGSKRLTIDDLLLADISLSCYFVAVRRWQETGSRHLGTLTREAFERCLALAAPAGAP